MGMDFTVLGAVNALNGNRSVDLGSPQQRALLSLLLLARGRPVLLDDLIDQMWGPNAPGSARVTLRTYITRLRHAFTDAGSPDAVIVTVPSGYRAPGTAGSLDLWAFEDRLKQAQDTRSRGDLTAASELLHSALSLWQGPALSGARAEFVDSTRHRLEELRLTALEQRIHVDLELGLHENLIAELTGLVAAHPLREQFHEFLMLALYRSGRQADALAAYHQVHELLNSELAIRPGPGLKRMQERILRADPDLQPGTTPTPTQHGPTATAVPTPAQLPADIPDFVGRREVLSQLVELLERADGPNLCALHGLRGMGKTTLAVHLAHGVRGRYPDGQLFVDLGGVTARSADPNEILGRFLRSIGCPGELPQRLEERAALWRSYVNGKRLLIVLDNATDKDQVRHLLPGSPGSAAIVTSVRRLSHVPALQWHRVDPLPRDESVDLFARIVGPRKAQAEPQASARLLKFAAGYPLALRMVGHRVAERKSWRITDVARQLLDDVEEPFEIHDDYRRLHEAVQQSETLVTPEVAAAFHAMAAVQASTFDARSLAALLDVSPVRALAILDSLADVHLLERLPECRFEMLDPVRVSVGNGARTKLSCAFERAGAMASIARIPVTATTGARPNASAARARAIKTTTRSDHPGERPAERPTG
jgi:DNA-binding SARP family transcriptional activator